MKRVLAKIVPTKEEEKKLLEVSNKILKEVEREAGIRDSRLRAIFVGSASRGTWLGYEKDLDIFVKFPIEYEKNVMEGIIERIGKRILRDTEKRYAEHPYIKGNYRGFEIEIVPCYAIERIEDLKSSVDRTPFHDEFVRNNIKGKENEARLLKQFLKGINCYGAEAKVEGFSGYLCELLVIKYGSFEKVLRSAIEWEDRQVIDMHSAIDEREARERFLSPLIFIDPVDDNRNVASALSKQKLSEFLFAAKEYLRSPGESFFFPRKRKIRRQAIIKKFNQRGTSLISLIFENPNVVDDILYTQLKKTTLTLEKLLRAEGFNIVGTDFFASKNVYILIELEKVEIPNARLHLGPKVNTTHVKNFLRKYKDYDKKLSEPFIKGNRWFIFLERRYNNAGMFLREFLSHKDLDKRGVPRYIARSIKKNFDIRLNEGCFITEFLPFLNDYFDPRFPWEVG